MKVFIIVALCVVAALALPVEENQEIEPQLTVADLELEDPTFVGDVALDREKRHHRGGS
jgi:hypothetical protein